MRTWIALVGAVPLVVSVSCATRPSASSSRAQLAALPRSAAPPDDAAEVRAGRATLSALDGAGRLVHDAEVEGYVTQVADRLFVAARAQRPGLAWQARVLDEPGVMRVRATPGGILYVSSGLLLSVAGEEELAAALAHAVGHVIAHHTVAASAGEDQPFGRIAEREADELGAYYLARAGYDPAALGALFSSLSADAERARRAAPLLRAHPVWPERLSSLERYLAEHPFARPPRPQAVGGDLATIRRRIEIAAAAPRLGS